MAEVKPMTVTVEALKAHTHAGTGPYDVGDTYEVAPHDVENLATQGMAVRVDRVAHAKRSAAKPVKAAKARKGRK